MSMPVKIDHSTVWGGRMIYLSSIAMCCKNNYYVLLKILQNFIDDQMPQHQLSNEIVRSI